VSAAPMAPVRMLQACNRDTVEWWGQSCRLSAMRPPTRVGVEQGGRLLVPCTGAELLGPITPKVCVVVLAGRHLQDASISVGSLLRQLLGKSFA
jgi:hypothetical protein